MNTIDSFKNYLLTSPFAETVRQIEGKILESKMISTDSKDLKQKTVYCISPYKTGTTYLSSCFNQNISKHEPLHYLSIKKLDEDFDKFFVKRLNHLNIKMECSGFWSAYVPQLAINEFAKNLNYICILRSPSSWVSSVVNYWKHPQVTKYIFDIPNELFWKPKVGVNLFEFTLGENNKKNDDIIEALINFYFDFTKNTNLLKNITYLPLKELDANLPLIGSMINEEPTISDRWHRKNKDKLFVFKDESIDKDYQLLTSKLIEK